MTGKEFSHPLQSFLKKAAQTLPTTTGKVAIQQARLNRRKGRVVILADVSASMAIPAWGGRAKIDILRQAVNAVRSTVDCHLIAFSDSALEVQSIPDPDSNTNMEAGLRAAQSLDPGVTLVISDGEPDNEAAALAVAGTFRGAIDVLYIGNESNRAAIDFMRKLAAAADGSVTVNDIATPTGVRRLQQCIAGLLRGPQS